MYFLCQYPYFYFRTKCERFCHLWPTGTSAMTDEEFNQISGCTYFALIQRLKKKQPNPSRHCTPHPRLTLSLPCVCLSGLRPPACAIYVFHGWRGRIGLQLLLGLQGRNTFLRSDTSILVVAFYEVEIWSRSSLLVVLVCFHDVKEIFSYFQGSFALKRHRAKQAYSPCAGAIHALCPARGWRCTMPPAFDLMREDKVREYKIHKKCQTKFLRRGKFFNHNWAAVWFSKKGNDFDVDLMLQHQRHSNSHAHEWRENLWRRRQHCLVVQTC